MSSSPQDVKKGVYFHSDLSLVYKNKKNKDGWSIPDREDGQDLSLHQRLAMNEALVFKKYKKITSSNNYNSQTIGNNVDSIGIEEGAVPRMGLAGEYLTLVTANIGFIISKNKKDNNRTFVTIPIDDPEFAIYYVKPLRVLNQTAEEVFHNYHAEEVLYNYLVTPDPVTRDSRLKRIVTNLSKELGCDDDPPKSNDSMKPKIHAVILDIHSSRELCNSLCEPRTYSLQQDRSADSFLAQLVTCLKDFGYRVRWVSEKRDAEKQLYCVTRVSAYLRYRSTEEIGIEKIGRNIKDFSNSVILHSARPIVKVDASSGPANEDHQYNYYRKSAYPEFFVPTQQQAQTIFINSGNGVNIGHSIEKKDLNFTP